MSTRPGQQPDFELSDIILDNPIIALSVMILSAVVVIVVVYVFKKFQKNRNQESETIANIMVPTMQVATMASSSRLHGPHTPFSCPVLKRLKEEESNGVEAPAKKQNWADWGNGAGERKRT